MKRKLFSAITLILVISLLFTSAAFAQDGSGESLFPVEIRNRTDQQVSLVLVGTDGINAYSLTVPAGVNQKFTLREGVYIHTTFSCGETASGTLTISGRLRLIFTACPSAAPNSGAPSLEKVHLTDAPKGKAWFYQYGRAALPAFAAGPDGMALGDCELTTTEETTVYFRPSTAADVFATVGAGFTIQVGARTQNGWLGFDPGVAQAANIGSFRLRWVAPGTGTLSGGCGSLPVVWGPPPGICFLMTMGDTNVHAEPDASSPVEVVLHVGEFAEILGKTADGDWAKVDLRPGNTGLRVEGWVDSRALNMNGPCADLPTVSP